MKYDFSELSVEELREIEKKINQEITERNAVVRNERFDAMIKAINEFKDVCPCAKVCDYDYSVYISYMADRDNWDFGD